MVESPSLPPAVVGLAAIALLSSVTLFRSGTAEPLSPTATAPNIRPAESRFITEKHGSYNFTNKNLHPDGEPEHHAKEHGKDQEQGVNEGRHGDGHSENGHDKEGHPEEEHHWSYHGPYDPEHWSALYRECASSAQRQSPIDVIPKQTKLNELLDEISFTFHHHVTGIAMTMINNGHTVNLKFNQTSARFSGGALAHTYRAVGVHFHWGGEDHMGSEHAIEGKHFPMEMHIVGFDEESYGSPLEAIESKQGISVLSTLFTLSDVDNEGLAPVISHLSDILEPGEREVSVPGFDLLKLLPPDLERYYRYNGSLTTPPCSEGITWTIFETKQPISHAQLAEFRQLYEFPEHPGDSLNETEHLLYNWRPTQPLGKRIVYRSFLLPDVSPVPDEQFGDADISRSGEGMVPSPKLILSLFLTVVCLRIVRAG